MLWRTCCSCHRKVSVQRKTSFPALALVIYVLVDVVVVVVTANFVLLLLDIVKNSLPRLSPFSHLGDGHH